MKDDNSFNRSLYYILIDKTSFFFDHCSAKHGASKLKHAKDLSEYAQKWAENLAAKNAFQHSDCVLKGERIGENICCKWSSSGADYTGTYQK